MAPKNAISLGHFLLLMLFIGSNFISLISSSIPHQENNNYYVNSDKPRAGSLPCSARYVVDSFFREYDSLVDSNFQDFMLHKIPYGSEITVSRLLNLERQLIGEGSHRHLSSSIRFSIQADQIGAPRSCDVIFIERLPIGVFADPFELEHLVHRGVFTDASVFGDTNLEMPSFRSNRSVVEVHLDAVNKSGGIVPEFTVEIPLHARYPPLEESGYSKVRFGVPELFMRCKTRGEPPTDSCLITPITVNDSLKLDDIVWIIPAGIKDHVKTVSVVTFASALLSSILIIIASVKHARTETNSRLKQS